MELFIVCTLSIIGWFASFFFAVKANKKAFSQTKEFQKELLEIDYINYQRKEFTLASANITTDLHKFYADSSKLTASLMLLKYDRNYFPSMVDVSKSIQDYYLNMNYTYNQFDFWVKISNFVDSDFKSIEHKFKYTFDPSEPDDPNKCSWAIFQMEIKNCVDTENRFSIKFPNLDEISDEKDFEVEKTNRISQIEKVLSSLEPLNSTSFGLIGSINKFCVNKNDSYQQIISPSQRVDPTVKTPVESGDE